MNNVSTLPEGLLTVEEASRILDKSSYSVRQLIIRGKLKKHMISDRVFVSQEDVFNYYPTKKGIPSYENNRELLTGRIPLTLNSTAAALSVQPSYIVKLVQKKLLEGYVTVSGDIFVMRDSVNNYLGKPDNDSDAL